MVVAGATYTTKATDGTWSIDTSVAPDSGTLAFDETLAFQISTLPPWVLIFSLKLIIKSDLLFSSILACVVKLGATVSITNV
jgi:hypothetical protein